MIRGCERFAGVRFTMFRELLSFSAFSRASRRTSFDERLPKRHGLLRYTLGITEPVKYGWNRATIYEIHTKWKLQRANEWYMYVMCSMYVCVCTYTESRKITRSLRVQWGIFYALNIIKFTVRENWIYLQCILTVFFHAMTITQFFLQSIYKILLMFNIVVVILALSYIYPLFHSTILQIDGSHLTLRRMSSHLYKHAFTKNEKRGIEKCCSCFRVLRVLICQYRYISLVVERPINHPPVHSWENAVWIKQKKYLAYWTSFPRWKLQGYNKAFI